ncbi:hypothetical protein [Agriterribacter sp.]|uniref:hypothetical protein n=1 Tax=Agriterribacter sp. TaxID=2821509 RepID=UPI002CE52797|nr:hypothetical protein [Agriterribacter sp.]HRP55306.1 hypothetical protein [Agriterribacter sp.]
MTNNTLCGRFNFLTSPVFILLALSIAYMILSFTPFRLGNDVLRYIQIKEWLEAGKHPVSEMGNRLPYGYPVLLLLLSKLGLCSSFYIVLVNYLYLGGSLYFVNSIFRSSIKAWQLIVLTLLNWTIVKSTITPLSDIQYLFFSTGALFFYTAYMDNKKTGNLAGLLIFTFLAIITRTIGVLLVFSMVLTLILQKKNTSRRKAQTLRILLFTTILFLIIIVVFSTFFRINDYINLMLSFFEADPAGFWITNLRWHLADLAEVFINTSQFKINFIGVGIKEIFFIATGVFSLIYFFFLLIKKKKDIPMVIIIYLLGYIIIVFNWPTYDARFWVPLVPLLIAVVLHTPVHMKPYLRYGFLSWKFVYVFLGTFVIGYYSYLIFNRSEFAKKHDAGIWKNEYETYFLEKPFDNRNTKTRPYILHVLYTYDR